MADTRAESRGIAWAGAVNLLGGAAGSMIGLLLAAIVGRHLGTTGAGTYFLVVAVFMIASSVAELGADTGQVRFVSAAPAVDRLADLPHLIRLAVVPVAYTGVVIVAVALGGLTAWPSLAAGLPPALLVTAAALVVLSSLTAVLLAATRGMGDALIYPLLQNIGLPVLRLVAVIVAVGAGVEVSGVLVSWLAPVPVIFLLAAAAVVHLLRRDVGANRSGPAPKAQRRRLSGEFWAFSGARGFSAAVEILLEWSDVLLVGALASPAEAGVYAVVTRCARASEVVQSAARISVGPHISAALARKDPREAGEIYGLVSAAMTWLSWPFFLLLAIFGDSVLSLFGPGFETGANALAILGLAMALATAAGTVQTILLMGGRSSWQLADKSGALVLNVGLNIVLIPVWGITGAAVAWAVTLVVDTAIVVFQVQRLMGVRPSAGNQPLLLAAGLALAVVGTLGTAARLLFGSSLPVLGVTIVVLAAAYLAISWPLRHRLGLPALLAFR
ncbi:polysaccharide biosynthesis C-terminal domain-containing protein [Aeromicrobium sp.]|uniref:polysaccharide biosynthesis C-terminal domain-containing protein n=1 Tax=Aeromicrobium sp. TaxID=1871063 RepID=UPI0030C343D7